MVKKAQNLRVARFQPKSAEAIRVVVNCPAGNTLEGFVEDMSINGIHFNVSSGNAEEIELEEILSQATLFFGSESMQLGRAVVRRIGGSSEAQKVAISLVDILIPLDERLSHFLKPIKSNLRADPYEFSYDSEKLSLAHFAESEYLNVDLFDRFRKFERFFDEWKSSDKFAYYFPRKNSMGSRVQIDLAKHKQENGFIMFGSNDYLGLASHHELKASAKKALDLYGFGSTGTPPTSGYSSLHKELCEKLANLFGREAAIIYPSGFSANLGIMSGLLREGDLVLADVLSHASIKDGIQLSHAKAIYFAHNDMNQLRALLSEHRANHNGCLIVTEGVFSMDGTIGKLDQIDSLAKEYNARWFVDQAHCMGVLGETGLGAVEQFGVSSSCDVIMGLFSKAIGSVGGFAVGDRNMINWLQVYSRPYLFATTVPPSTVAASIKGLELMQDPELRKTLHRNIKHFVQRLRSIGAEVSENHGTAIIPVEIGDERIMGKVFQAFLAAGIYVLPVVYPVVSRTRCRFRFSIRADHSLGDLDYACATFEKALAIAGTSFHEITAKRQLRIENEKLKEKDKEKDKKVRVA